MTNEFDSTLKEKLISFAIIIEKELGLTFRSEQKLYDLYSKLFNLSSSIDNQEKIISIIDIINLKREIPKDLLTPIANILTINETYFFRESNIYPLLKSHIDKIVNLENVRDIKIWSAGCSSGEEPYSIAIFIKENYPQDIVNRVKIIASDISEKALQKAANGVFSKWSFRDVKPHIINRYFNQSNGEYIILESIKEMVVFKNFNLITNSYPDYGKGLFDLDIILCRNVLMYFSEESIGQISTKFFNSLLSNGILITSAVEMNDLIFKNFVREVYGECIFYRKAPDNPILDKKGFQNLKNKPSIGKIEKRKKQDIISTSIIKKDSIDILPKQHLTKSIDYIRELANRGDLNLATRELNILIENGSSESIIYYLYALVLSEKKETSKALNMCQKALYLDSQNLEAMILSGFLYMESNQKEKAIKSFQTSLKIMEKTPDNELNSLFEEGINGSRLKEIIESLYIDLDSNSNG